MPAITRDGSEPLLVAPEAQGEGYGGTDAVGTGDAPAITESEAKATVPSTVLVLVANVVGAGLFSMPWVLRQASVLSGLLLLTLICFLNGLSFVILAKCCDVAGCFNYKKIGTMALGPRLGTLVQVCILCYTTGSCISYVVLTGDFLVSDDSTGVFAQWAPHSKFLTTRSTVMICVALVFFLPLSLFKNLENLKHTSLLSFCSTLFATGLLIWCSVQGESKLVADGAVQNDAHEKKAAADIKWGSFSTSFFDALPIVNVAFTAHYNGLRFYQELQDRSIAKFARTIAISSSICLLVYGAAALSGYLVFGSATEGDVLENFQGAWPAAIAARLMLSCVVICCFPLAHHSLRTSLLTLFWPPLPADEAQRVRASAPPGPDGDDLRARADGYTTENAPRRIFIAVTVAAISFVTFIGVTVTKVEDVLGYKGAIFGSCIVYIFPPFMLGSLLRQRRHEKVGLEASNAWTRKLSPRDANECRLGSMALYGLITGLIAVVVTIIKQAG